MEYIKELEKGLKDKGYGKAYINKCVKYSGFLLENNLPVIFDKQHLAKLLGMNINTLSYYLLVGDSFYKIIYIPKKNGDYRKISMPSYNLKYIQRWILNNILYNMPVNEQCMGFVKGRSILNNAQPHINKELVVNLDIERFFDSIKFEQIFRVIYHNGYTREVSFILTKLLTHKGCLPQGSPASPYMANLVAQGIDRRFYKLSNKIGATYTRYADDITISGNREIYGYIKTYIKILKQEGFRVNNKKLKIQFKKYRQEVTGLIVNNESVAVKKEVKRDLRKHIYYCRKFGVYKHLQNTGNEYKAHFKEYLYGKARYIYMIEPVEGANFFKELNEIDWES